LGNYGLSYIEFPKLRNWEIGKLKAFELRQSFDLIRQFPNFPIRAGKWVRG